MLKIASLLGVQHALVEAGVLLPYPSREKAAQAATVAAQAMPQEVQAAGEFITPQDLASLDKIVGVLYELQAMYQQSQGAPQGGQPMGAPQMGGQPMGAPPPQGGQPMGAPQMGGPPMGGPPMQ